MGTSKPLPTDSAIEIAFDRLLNPLTVTRQSVVLRDAAGNAVSAPIVTYDPVARVVTLQSPAAGGSPCWLDSGQPYTVTLGVPQGPGDTSGLRSIDGAPLDPSGTLQIGFMTSSPACSSSPPAAPHVDFCVDLFTPIFQQRCSAPQCHGSPTMVNPQTFPQFPDGMSRPAAGLVLDSAIGIQNTALRRAAQGSNTGPHAGYGSPPGPIFAVDMPIVDPGDPGNSWLLYKTLLAPPPAMSAPDFALVCGGSVIQPAPSFEDITPGAPMSNDERARLANFIPGREMPYPTAPGAGDPVPPDKTLDNPTLSIDELERLRIWIAAGATVVDCSTCTAVDAGSDAPADGPVEAAPDSGRDAGVDAPQDGPAEDAPPDAPPG